MNQNFILLDKSNNVQKKANIVVKISYENKDYLVYSIDESDKNEQIFISKLVLNSEGKYFIDELSLEEKNKLNNIVYNVIIITPTEYKKGNDGKNLIENLSSKFFIKISTEAPILDMQEYYNSCSIAITSKELVAAAIEFYNLHLNSTIKQEEEIVPVWEIPTEIVTTTNAQIPSMQENDNISIPISSINETTLLETDSDTLHNQNLSNNDTQTMPINISNDNAVITESIIPEINNVEISLPNPQKEKLAIISDPSLNSSIGISPRNIQPNIQNMKKAGFANNKYLIIGTICFALAVAVVIIAYFLIKNMK